MTVSVVQAVGEALAVLAGWCLDVIPTPSVFDIWVKPTEAAGGAQEAHRRWPEGRSEQGREQGKGRPSNWLRAAARFSLPVVMDQESFCRHHLVSTASAGLPWMVKPVSPLALW